VPSLNALVRSSTDLTEDDLDWLHVLLGEWQLLADLSFADLVLWLPLRSYGRYVVGAQIRPTTGQTLFDDDLLGLEAGREERNDVARAHAEGRIVNSVRTTAGATAAEAFGVEVEAVPVRRAGRVVAVVSRHYAPPVGQGPSPLEEAYLDSARVLSRMVSEGRFPFPAVFGDPEIAPRVGDGLLRLDASGAVTYASPNALSAYRRLGLSGPLLGENLGGLTSALAPAVGPVDEAVSVVTAGRAPRTSEVETPAAVLLLRAIPLQPGGVRTGALVLVRDVTDVRRRDRAMATKDATIREIHHRVKNNLQTVAALLRLQGRRIDEPAARLALAEAERRVESIAIVHETLSHTPDEFAAFDEIVDRLAAMVSDVGTLGGTVTVRRSGTFGVLPAQIATPLAMALTELLQNAVQHGFGFGRDGRARSGVLDVRATREGGRLRVVVDDDGLGLPPHFDAEASGRLGLQIVRTLVVGELGGALDLGPRREGGTRALVDVPLPERPE
jgi:two-component system, sensor histidine kinase PdtaS